MPLAMHQALEQVDARVAAVEEMLEAWLAAHPAPERKRKTEEPKPAVPLGGGAGWDWRLFTLINGPWVDDPNSVIYQSWNPGLFR